MTDELYEVMTKGIKRPAAKPETLDVIDENASKCCKKAFSKMPTNFDGARFCPACGTEFRPSMVGPVRHWRIYEYFAVHRRR